MDARTSRSRHPDSLGQAFLWVLLPSLVLFLIAPSVGDAQEVATNITPSALPACPGPCGPGVTLVTPLPPGQGGTITITGGARPGGNGPNLFHSFGRFDVGTGDIANFFNETGLPTSNILSRVTGGNQSQIYGTIQTTNFPGANLFLMNPAGVLFGATALLDLGAVTGSAVRQPGSFYATTADYINLVDVNGTSPFYADPAKASVLSVAPVAAFGFLALEPGVTRGTISVQGSILQVPEGQSLSLVGGDITVQAGTLEDGTIQAASLRAPGGQLNLVSVASPGEVLIPSFQTGPNINGASFTTMGTVTLKEGATLDVSGQFDEFGTLLGNGNSGTVFVRGGQLVMDASFIQGNTLASVDGAPTAVDVQVSQDVALTKGAEITSYTFGKGRGGDVQITAAESVTLNGSTITAQTQFGPGPGGDVSITAGTLLIDTLSRVTSESFLGTGTGGKLVLNVGNLTVGGGSSVGTFNTTFEFDVDGDGVLDPGSFGVGGNLTIQGIRGSGAAGSVVLSGGGSEIRSLTGDGAGGSLSVTTTLLSLDEASSINSSTGGKGGGGDIALSVQNAILSGGATIASGTTYSSQGAGAGGKITVRGLNGIIKADSLELEGFRSGIISDSSGLSRPGDIEVHAKMVSLTGGAAIEGGNRLSLGTGANVDIDADSVRIVGTAVGPGSESHISSQNFGLSAGQVTITADQLTLDNGGSIVTSTESFSGGRGGDVEVNVKVVSLANGSTINSSTSGTGRAGDITMNVGSLTLANHSEITNSSTGIATGAAGSVTIQGLASPADAVTLTNSSLLTSADSTGRGGSITVDATNLTLNGATISASVKDVNAADVTDGPTSGLGNIALTSSTMNMTGSTVTAETSGTRNAGTIAMITTGNTLNVSGGSITSSTTSSGNAGQILITSPVLSLNNATITTNTSSSGNAGGITANVGTLTLANAAEIASSSTEAATGAAGSVIIQGLASPANAVTLTDSSLRTSADSTGRGGSIKVDATNVTLNGATISASVKDVNAADVNDVPTSGLGNIALTSSTINMNGSTVTAETVGTRNAGTIAMITTGNTLNVSGGSITSSTTSSGNAGQILITSPVLSLNNATITTSTSSTGNAGGIKADVGTLTLTNAAEIASSSTGTILNAGDAGSVTIQGLASPADAVTITNSSLLTKAEGSGQGGDISVSGLTVTLNNATISATANAGNAGSVTIKDANTVQSTSGSVTTESTTGAGGSITIDAANSINLSGTAISAKVTGGTKDGGNITFNAGNAGQQVTMENGTVVSAQSLSTDKNAGDAGTVTVNAGNQFLMNNSTITTESTNAGGGRVEINVADGFMVQLINSGIKTSVFGGSDTKGGNINIDPQFVILQNSQILAQAVAGEGGAINIIAGSAFIADPASIVDASSTLGISGTINIQSPLQNVGGRLTPLSQQFSSAAALLAQRCAARVADGKFSTFVVAGREGLPVEPGGFLASPSLTAELLGSSLSGLYPHTQFSAVTGAFPEYDARPIQLAKYGDACRQ